MINCQWPDIHSQIVKKKQTIWLKRPVNHFLLFTLGTKSNVAFESL